MALARKRAGMTQNQLATKMGEHYDQTLLSRVETGKAGLAAEGMAKAAKALGVSIDYICGLTDDPTPARQLAEGSSPRNTGSPDVVLVPMVAAVVGSEGDKEEYDATILEQLPLPSRWLKECGSNPDNCHVLSVKGDLMAPTLPDGCSILVDVNVQEYRDDGIFLLQFEQRVIERTLKYLMPLRLTLDKGSYGGAEYEDWHVSFDKSKESTWPLKLYDVKSVIGEVLMVVAFPHRAEN